MRTKNILDKLFFIVVFLQIFAAPLIFTNLSFEIPKVFVISITSLTLSLALIFYKKLKLDSWDYLAGFFVLILLTASLRAGSLGYSLLGSEYRRQGILVLSSLILFFVAARRLFNDSRSRELVGKMLIFSATLQSLIVIIQFFQLNILELNLVDYSGRPVGTFGQPNIVAGFLVVGFSLSLGYLSLTKKYWYLLTLTLLVLGILFTQSQGALLALLVVSIVAIGKWINSKKLKIGFIIVAFLALVGGLVFYLKQDANFSPLGVPQVGSRISIWSGSVKLIGKRPLIGYGVENIYKIFPDEFGGGYIDRAHNSILDIGITGGVFLVFTYLVFVFGGLYVGFKDERLFPFTLAMLAIVARDLVNTNSIFNIYLYWLLLAILLIPNITKKVK